MISDVDNGDEERGVATGEGLIVGNTAGDGVEGVTRVGAVAIGVDIRKTILRKTILIFRLYNQQI